MTSRMCGWCHEMNPITRKYCHKCGHEAHASRMACKCPQCSGQFEGLQGNQVTEADVEEVIKAIDEGRLVELLQGREDMD